MSETTITIEVTSNGSVVCAYFLNCTREAAGVTTHPVLDYVPTCQPCADRFGLEVIPAVWEAE